MSLEIENDMTGLAFAVDSNNENAPDYSGSIKVDGKTYDVALWAKEFKKSDGFSIKVSEPYKGGSRRNDDDDEEAPPRRSSGGSSRGGVKPRPKPQRR